MKLLGHRTMDTHVGCARALTGELRRMLDSDRPVEIDDVALLARGAVGDLAQVWAVATIGRDLTPTEGALLALAAQRAVHDVVTDKTAWACDVPVFTGRDENLDG